MIWCCCSSLSSMFTKFIYLLDLHSFPTRRSSDLETAPTHDRSKPCAASALGKARLISIAGSVQAARPRATIQDRKSTRLNSSHMSTSYAVFCLKKKTAAVHE